MGFYLNKNYLITEMPSYKLMYFNFPGRAELIRLIFSAAKVEFDDHRVAREDWPKVKQEMPFNAMPVLYIDGTPLCESGAIQRFLASEFDLNGSNNLQAAYIEMVTGLLSDCYPKPPFFEKDPEKKKAENSGRAQQPHSADPTED